MQFSYYWVTYSAKDRFFDAEWDYYRIEASSSKEALKFAKEKYQRELDAGIRNLAPMKEVKFSVTKRN